MTANSLEMVASHAHELTQELSELDNLLHAAAASPTIFNRKEAAAALKVHRQICDSLVIANRIMIWSSFSSPMFAWDGELMRKIDTSAYSIGWATRTLDSIEGLFTTYRRELRTIRKVARRVAKHQSGEQAQGQVA